MAVKKWTGKESIKWSSGKNWNPESTTAFSDELEVLEGTPNIEQNATAAKAKQLIFGAGYTGTFSGAATGVLSIGTTTGTGTALKLVNSMGLTCESEIKFISTSKVIEGITTAGKTLSFGLIVFNGLEGKWRFEDDFTHTSGNGVALNGGALDCNNKTVKLDHLELNSELARNFKLGTGKLILNGVTPLVASTKAGLTFEASSGLIEIVSSTAEVKANELAFGTLAYTPFSLIGSGLTFNGSNTIANLNINNKGATAEKGGLKLQAAVSQTITTSITSNGAAGALARLESATPGTRAKIKIPEGVIHHVKSLAVKDVEVLTGSLVVEEGKDEGNNFGNISFGSSPSFAMML